MVVSESKPDESPWIADDQGSAGTPMEDYEGGSENSGMGD